MPKAIELAVLCDAATFRDDLLSVLGAGITTLTAEELPALAELTLVAQLAFTEPDIGSKETLVVDATDEAGERLASMTFALTPERPRRIHATRCAVGGISEGDVESALTNGVADLPDSRPNCRLTRGLDTRGDILEVVLNQHNEVVTVYRP